jgi:HAE1 family hydrophobic/amphiphilic exporter-1
MKLAKFAVNRPITLGMLTISMVVLGVISFTRIPMEAYPSMSSSQVRVGVNYPSASPEELERDITVPLEQSLAMLGNIERISARSGGNSANVSVDFKAGTDMDLAVMEVRDRIDQARPLLPDDVDRISLFRWSNDAYPVLEVDLAWKGADERLFDVVRKVVEPRMLRLDGVANVTIDGIEEKQLIIELDQQRLEDHGVSLTFLASQLQANNIDVSLGRVEDGGRRYLTRVRGEFQHPEEIGNLPLAGSNLRISDLGTVRYEYPERESYERLNGRDAVEVQVYKVSTDNTVEVALKARNALQEILADYDGLLDFNITRDRADQILAELSKLKDAALLGALLAVGIIYLFLRSIRSTIAIAIAIPASVCCVFTGIYVAREFFDSAITLNMVSMMGLMLAVGMLVDPAVVTLESIFRRREEEGASPADAAISGTTEVGMAVLASSLTTMCVFVPFFFLGFGSGRVVRFMGDAGLTICLAVGVSTVVALAVIPLAASRLFQPRVARYDGLLKIVVATILLSAIAWKAYHIGWASMVAWAGTTGSRVLDRTLGMEWSTASVLGVVLLLTAALGWRCRRHGMRSSYVSLLNWTLGHRAATLTGAVGMMGLGVWLFTNIEQQGMRWPSERRVDITVETERSYSLEEIDAIFHTIEADLLAHAQELDLETLSTRVRQRRGTISARLVDADEGHLTTMEAQTAIRSRLPEHVGVVYKMGRSRSWTGNLLGVEVQLKGGDSAVLEVLAEDVKERLAQLPGVSDVDTSLEDGVEEIRVSVDREQALGYGLSPRQVATTISTALGVRRTTSFKAPEREIGVIVQLEEADRVNLEQLKNTSFESRDDTRVQLAALADFSYAQAPRSLQREDRQQTLNVFANTASRNAAYQLNPQVEQMMQTVALPPGYSWQFGQAARWDAQDTDGSNYTLLFAMLLIYLIMASLFESLVHPFTIMFAIPFSLIGVAAALWSLDVPFDPNAMLGMLILFGIVVNNGIVLIDHINQYRREGMSRHEAILKGGQNRMRPILMTAGTTILNLMPLVLPMVYGTAEGFSRRWGPIGLVVVSGLATSTILTLVLAPTIYSLLDDLSAWARRVVRAANPATS